MLSFNYLYAVMIITVITIMYKHYSVKEGAKRENPYSFESVLGTIMIVTIFLPIILSVEYLIFMLLTGRDLDLQPLNSPPQRNYSPARRNYPPGSPLVVDSSNKWGIDIPLFGGLRITI